MKTNYFLILLLCCFSCGKSNFEKGVDHYKKGDYSFAIKELISVKEGDPNYPNAVSLLTKIDSIYKVEKEQQFNETVTVFHDAEIWKKGQTRWEDIDALITSVLFFEQLARTAKTAIDSENEGIKEKGIFIQKNLPVIQKRDFPTLRREYARIVGEQLWRDNVKVEAKGNRGTTIVMIGGFFASNANIEDAQKEVHELLMKLRFKRSEYKWIPSASEYVYYKIESRDDGDIDY